jgi:hypothetical protein
MKGWDGSYFVGRDRAHLYILTPSPARLVQLPTLVGDKCLCLALTPEQQNSTDNRSRVQAQQQEYSAPQLIKLKMMAARPAISPHCGTYSPVILASYPNIVQEQIVMPPLRPSALQYPLQRHPPQTRGL